MAKALSWSVSPMSMSKPDAERRCAVGESRAAVNIALAGEYVIQTTRMGGRTRQNPHSLGTGPPRVACLCRHHPQRTLHPANTQDPTSLPGMRPSVLTLVP